MKIAELQIAQHGNVVDIKVSGRANFVHGTPLRDFAVKMVSNGVKEVRFFMSDCMAMDSTFMGSLSMIALQAKRGGIKVVLINMPENCRQLLKGLGVDKLFDYVNDETLNFDAGEIVEGNMQPVNVAESVVEAHETLINVAPENACKFEKVVEFAKNDLAKLKK